MTSTNAATTTAIDTTRTAMTTEPREPTRGPLLGASTLELRSYLVAALAAVYTITLRAIGGHAPAMEPPPVSAPIAGDPPRSAWLGSVPPAIRPAITLPAGWQIVSARATPPSQPAAIVRVPDRRVPRVRTRSS